MKRKWMVPVVMVLGLCLANTGVYAESQMKEQKEMGMHGGKMGMHGGMMGMHGGMMGMHGGMMGMGHMGLKMKFMFKAKWILGNSKVLGLSEAQEEKIKKLKVATKKSLIKQDADIETVGVDLGEALSGYKINVGSANNLVKKKYDLKRKRAESLVWALADLKQILKEDQYEKLKGLKMNCSSNK